MRGQRNAAALLSEEILLYSHGGCNNALEIGVTEQNVYMNYS